MSCGSLQAVDRKKSIEHEAAVLAVLAFLFEECEIFEAAPEGPSN